MLVNNFFPLKPQGHFDPKMPKFLLWSKTVKLCGNIWVTQANVVKEKGGNALWEENGNEQTAFVKDEGKF